MYVNQRCYSRALHCEQATYTVFVLRQIWDQWSTLAEEVDPQLGRRVLQIS